MTTGEFADLVAKMRWAQKIYFSTRAYGDLMASKKLEGEVDEALKDRARREADKAQPGLGL
jgi:hypothetical protein